MRGDLVASFDYRSRSLEHPKSRAIRDSKDIKPSSLKLPQAIRLTFLKQEKSFSSSLSHKTHQTGSQTALKTLCQLCQCFYPDVLMDSIGTCGHLFCRQCLRRYIEYKLSVVEQVACPQSECTILIHQSQHCFTSLTPKQQQQYRQHLNWRRVKKDSSLKICPTPNCLGTVSVDPLFCKLCGVHFCGQCMLPLHPGSCQGNFQEQFFDYKRCPKCDLLIEKQLGCNHIVCKCGHQFCYACLEEWSQRHYICARNPSNENSRENSDNTIDSDLVEWQLPESTMSILDRLRGRTIKWLSMVAVSLLLPLVVGGLITLLFVPPIFSMWLCKWLLIGLEEWLGGCWEDEECEMWPQLMVLFLVGLFLGGMSRVIFSIFKRYSNFIVTLIVQYWLITCYLCQAVSEQK